MAVQRAVEVGGGAEGDHAQPARQQRHRGVGSPPSLEPHRESGTGSLGRRGGEGARLWTLGTNMCELLEGNGWLQKCGGASSLILVYNGDWGLGCFTQQSGGHPPGLRTKAAPLVVESNISKAI